jgi:KUP system potassium uptake protein
LVEYRSYRSRFVRVTIGRAARIADARGMATLADTPAGPAPQGLIGRHRRPRAERARASGATERRRPAQRTGMAALALGAIGVVFGDIGTSPLYSMQTIFGASGHAVRATAADAFGIASLVFWAITIVVSVKYVTFIMRADNDGEGGIMALTALLRRSAGRRGFTGAGLLVALGVFGASLFYGDGMITPAISVLSAVEGLQVATPSLAHLVLPIALVVLSLLFAIQRWGTAVVGRLFGPVMLVWFAVIGAAGAAEIGRHPAIVAALSPSYAAAFVGRHPAVAFIAFGSVVLAITGAEALYADMGHFGREPIRRAWFFAILPALTLNYLGQASLIAHSPAAVRSPFFLLIPAWGQLPMVLLATVATVIASQSVISGAFSVTRQLVQLGFLPRVLIRHTSAHQSGQIYVPAVNRILYLAVVGLVVGFGSSAHLASAYGLSVTGTFLLDTVLFLAVARVTRRAPVWKIAAGALVFGAIDLAFFGANVTKLLHGAWLPVAVGLVAFTVLWTWQAGRLVVTRNRTEEEGPLRDFVERLRAGDTQVHRAPGAAVFLSPGKHTTPLAMRASVERSHVLPETVVILTVDTLQVPHVPDAERIVVDDLGRHDDGILHVTARFGYLEDPDVPAALRLAREHELVPDLAGVDLDDVTYFVSRITLVPTAASGIAAWRKRLFVTVAKHAASPVAWFRLPIERTVTMGSHIRV